MDDIAEVIADIALDPVSYGFENDGEGITQTICEQAIMTIDVSDFETNYLSDPPCITANDEYRYATMLYDRARDTTYNAIARDIMTAIPQKEVLF